MRQRFVCWVVVSFCLVGNMVAEAAENTKVLPSFAAIQAIVEQHFAAQRQFRSGDIICQSDVLSLFPRFEAAGWKVEDRDALIKKMLPASDPLIGILRSANGVKFMGEVSNEKLIYDRLDRIAQEPGGQRLLTDLVKLPNAARYAKMKTEPGVPDLEDFLPKGRSGKARHVKDYDKPSEKVYTVDDFKKALQKSYSLAQRNVRS